MTATLILYIVLNGQMTTTKMPMPTMQDCKQAMLESNDVTQSRNFRIVHVECKPRKERVK